MNKHTTGKPTTMPSDHSIPGAAPNVTTGSGYKAQSANERLLVCASLMAAYARYTELHAIENSVTVIPVTDQDLTDYKRLRTWWSGLGEDKQNLIIRWKDEMWVECEAITREFL